MNGKDPILRFTRRWIEEFLCSNGMTNIFPAGDISSDILATYLIDTSSATPVALEDSLEKLNLQLQTLHSMVNSHALVVAAKTVTSIQSITAAPMDGAKVTKEWFFKEVFAYNVHPYASMAFHPEIRNPDDHYHIQPDLLQIEWPFTLSKPLPPAKNTSLVHLNLINDFMRQSSTYGDTLYLPQIVTQVRLLQTQNIQSKKNQLSATVSQQQKLQRQIGAAEAQIQELLAEGTQLKAQVRHLRFENIKYFKMAHVNGLKLECVSPVYEHAFHPLSKYNAIGVNFVQKKTGGANIVPGDNEEDEYVLYTGYVKFFASVSVSASKLCLPCLSLSMRDKCNCPNLCNACFNADLLVPVCSWGLALVNWLVTLPFLFFYCCLHHIYLVCTGAVSYRLLSR